MDEYAEEKRHTDRNEASCGLFATAELLVISSSSSFISFKNKNKNITENSSKKNENNKNRTGEAKILLLPQPTVNERSMKKTSAISNQQCR